MAAKPRCPSPAKVPTAAVHHSVQASREKSRAAYQARSEAYQARQAARQQDQMAADLHQIARNSAPAAPRYDPNRLMDRLTYGPGGRNDGI